MIKKFNIIFFFVLFSFASVLANDWDWDKIDPSNMNFPKNFLWGSATCEYQNSGAQNCPNNNWATWENAFDENGKSRIKNAQKSKKSTDHYNLYKEDIYLMKNLGLNSYRFSIEWSLIEPEEGKFDNEAIEHYKNLIDELIKNGITPMITLHHFTTPNWFHEKGSFEKEENIDYFVRFSSFVFNQFSNKVNLWCTINEPAIYSFVGYVLGRFPPGEVDLQKAGDVLKNLLIAHTKVYEKLKSLPNGQNSKIGIVHNILKFEPYNSWNPIESIPCSYLSDITSNAVVEFFKTGYFNFYIPLKAYTTYENFDPKLDFVGLNYYSHPLLKMQISYSEPLYSSCYEGQEMSDYTFRLYPEGLYRAIEEISAFNVPIYITENGIPDNNDTKRSVFINRYLYALSKAIEDGFDVRGYFYWTLVDNFEWNEGFLVKFGLYDVDFDTQQRTLKPGALAYKKIIDDWKKKNTK